MLSWMDGSGIPMPVDRIKQFVLFIINREGKTKQLLVIPLSVCNLLFVLCISAVNGGFTCAMEKGKEIECKATKLKSGPLGCNLYSRLQFTIQSLFISSLIQFAEIESYKMNHSITILKYSI